MGRNKRVYGVLLGVFLFILAGFVVQEIYLHAVVRRQMKIECPESKEAEVSVMLQVSPGWKSGDAVGAQYDGIVYNHMPHAFRDWRIELEVPEEAQLDGVWNGAYVKDENVLTITPVDYNREISANAAINFGFIMYYKEVLDIEGITVVGYPVIAHRSLLSFWILTAAAAVWLLAVVICLLDRLRARILEKRQEDDEKIILQSMNTFTGLIDAKDSYTKGHSVRVSEYVAEIARRMEFSEHEIEKLRYIALMHDCGKTGIPDAVLNKPDKLTTEERRRIENHTVIGGEILENFTVIEGLREGAMYHHERYDGTGYPLGKKAEEIPLYARIICVADSYDAMSSNRCYRKHLDKEAILKELEDNAGTQFDPNIVKYMIEMIKDGFVDSVYTESADFM